MKCPTCGADNREGAKYCQNCRTILNAVPVGVGAQAAPVPQVAAMAQDVDAQVADETTSPKAETHPLPVIDESGPETKPLDISPSAKPHRKTDTQPLEGLPEFAPLPVGALLQDGRYEILQVVTSNGDLNAYIAVDNVPVRLCPNCHQVSNEVEEVYCSSCGADLSQSEALNFRYRLHEGASVDYLGLEPSLMQLGLNHPTLELAHAIFSETPYGAVVRFYKVEPEFPHFPTTDIVLPQEPVAVLQWGSQLASGLDYLHRNYVVLPNMKLSSVSLSKGRAVWIDLGSAQVLSEAERGAAASAFAKDVRELARLIGHLASDGKNGHLTAGFPKEAEQLLVQAYRSPETVSATQLAVGLEEALEALRRPVGATLIVGKRTDVGVERPLNEDSILVMDLALVTGAANVQTGLYVVADGMGGHDAGEVASQLTVQSLGQRVLADALPSVVKGVPIADVTTWLKTAVEYANRVVHEQRRSAGTEMGTTCVAALVVDGKAIVANVGDSRAYLLDPEGISQISVDHSLVERLVATGQITAEEARYHPQRNVIYRVIGDKLQVEVDMYEQALSAGEALLLCSDGLSGMLSDAEMFQLWQASISPQEACDRLVDAACQAGGHDNISVIIVQLGR